MSILEVAVDPATVIVAVDPGKVLNGVWVSNGAGLLEDPVSLPVSREGIGRLERLLRTHAAAGPVIAIEATGSLHRSWASELERLRRLISLPDHSGPPTNEGHPSSWFFAERQRPAATARLELTLDSWRES